MRNHFLRTAVVTSTGGEGSYVTDDLVFHIDAGNSSCYSGSGTTVNSLVGSITSNHFDSDVSYSSSDGGSFDFSSNNTGKGIGFDISSFSPIGSNNFTYEMWYKITNAWCMPIMMKSQESGSTFPRLSFYSLYQASDFNKLNIYTTHTDGFRGVYSNDNTFSHNTWQHVVVTINASTTVLTMYVNGSQAGSDSHYTYADFYDVSNDSVLHIGGDARYTFYDLNGNISICRIYKGRALSSSEVTQNYNAEKARYGY